MGALYRFHDLLMSVASALLSVFAMILLVLLGDPTFREGFHIHLIPEAIALFAMGFSLGTAADLFSWPRKTGWSIIIAIYSVTVILFSIWTGLAYKLASIIFSSWLPLGYGLQRALNASARRVMVNIFFAISAMIVAALTFLGVLFASYTIIPTITKEKIAVFFGILLAALGSLIVLCYLTFFYERIKPSN